ncbi:MAG: hypothetical protein QXZ49_01035 [Nitrososphaerota archaeon]
MGPVNDLTKVISEMKETIQFLEKQLESGSRLELIINHVEDILESLDLMLSDTALPESMRVQVEGLLIKARYISEKAKNMLDMLERETRNLKPKSRTWE